MIETAAATILLIQQMINYCFSLQLKKDMGVQIKEWVKLHIQRKPARAVKGQTTAPTIMAARGCKHPCSRRFHTRASKSSVRRFLPDPVELRSTQGHWNKVYHFRGWVNFFNLFLVFITFFSIFFPPVLPLEDKWLLEYCFQNAHGNYLCSLLLIHRKGTHP